jgi:hypothetical protein
VLADEAEGADRVEPGASQPVEDASLGSCDGGGGPLGDEEEPWQQSPCEAFRTAKNWS